MADRHLSCSCLRHSWAGVVPLTGIAPIESGMCCGVRQTRGCIAVPTCFLASLQAKNMHQGCSPSVVWPYAPGRLISCGEGPTACAPRPFDRLPASLTCCLCHGLWDHIRAACLSTRHCFVRVSQSTYPMHTAFWLSVQLCSSPQTLSHAGRPLTPACVACQCTQHCSMGCCCAHSH